MIIKTLDDLKKLREQSTEKIFLRKYQDSLDNVIEIVIGISEEVSKSREILNIFMSEVRNNNLNNVKVLLSDSIGQNYIGPVVQVTAKGQSAIMYDNVTIDKVKRICEEHVKGGRVVQDLLAQSTT